MSGIVGFRPGPPVPELSLSEDFVLSTATTLQREVNKALATARKVALGKDFKLFLLVSRGDLDSDWAVQSVTARCSFDHGWRNESPFGSVCVVVGCEPVCPLPRLIGSCGELNVMCGVVRR